MPIHPLWIVAVIVVLMMVVVPLIVIAVLAGSRPHASAPVQYSPDGRWWWDGRQWQPAPHPPLPSQPSPPAP